MNLFVTPLIIAILIFCIWHWNTPSHRGVRMFKITNILCFKINVWIDYMAVTLGIKKRPNYKIYLSFTQFWSD